jgi:hypothetical protein
VTDVTKVSVRPTIELGNITTILTLERNPVGTMLLAFSDILGPRLTPGANQIFDIHVWVSTTTFICASKVWFFALEAREEEIVMQGKLVRFLVVRTTLV